jgi:hypothetical protein
MLIITLSSTWEVKIEYFVDYVGGLIRESLKSRLV